MDPRARTSTSTYDVKTDYIAHGLSPSTINLWRQSQQLILQGEEVHATSGENSDTFPTIFAQAPVSGGPFHLPQLNEYTVPSFNIKSMQSFNPNTVCSQVLSKTVDGRMLDPNSHAGHGHHDVKLGTPNLLRSGSPFHHEDELVEYDSRSPFPGPLPESFRELLLQESSRAPHGLDRVSEPSFKISGCPPSQLPDLYRSVGTLMAGMQQYCHALGAIGNHCDRAAPLDHNARQIMNSYDHTNMNTQGALRAEAKAVKDTIGDQSSAAAIASTEFKGCDYRRANQRINEGVRHNYGRQGEEKATLGNNIASSCYLQVLDRDKQHAAAAAAAASADRTRFNAGSSSSNMICFGQSARPDGVSAADDDGEVLFNIGDLPEAFMLTASHDELAEQQLQQESAGAGAASAAQQLLHAVTAQYQHKRRGTANSVALQQLVGGVGLPRPRKTSRNPLGPALNTNLKPRARQGSANDPQSIAARQRRERINSRLKTLQELVPNGSKVDLVTMLEKAINYVKFLQLQLKVLTDDEFWSNAQQLIGQEGSSLIEKGLAIEGNSSLESSNALSK